MDLEMNVDEVIIASKTIIDEYNIVTCIEMHDFILEKYNSYLEEVKPLLSKHKFYNGLVEELDYLDDMKILLGFLEKKKKDILKQEDRVKNKSLLRLVYYMLCINN